MTGARRTPVQIGVLGGGMIAQIGHLPFYVSDPRCRVVKIAEERPSLAAPLRKIAPDSEIVPDYRAVLDDPAIDAVVISVPRAATGPVTLDALAAGKHVLAEKPMAHTSAQARRLVEAAQAAKAIYAIGFMKRYDPGLIAAKAAVDEAMASGRLGRLLLARFYDHSKSYAVPPPPHKRPEESRATRFAVWPTAPDWLEPGCHEPYAWFMNAGSHDVNLMNWFFPAGLALQSADMPSPEAVIASFRQGRTSVTLEVSRCAAGRWIEGAEFIFETGRIAVSIPSPMAVDRVSEVTRDDSAAGLVAQPLKTETGWSFARQAKGFVDTLHGQAPAGTSGAEGLADILLIEEMWTRINGQP